MKLSRLQMNRKLQAGLLMASLLLGTFAIPAQAYDRHEYYRHHHGYYDRYHYYRGGFLPGHPFVRGAAVGGGLGAAAGAIFSPEGSKGDGAIKGALLGGGAGLGYEFLRTHGYLSRW